VPPESESALLDIDSVEDREPFQVYHAVHGDLRDSTGAQSKTVGLCGIGFFSDAVPFGSFYGFGGWERNGN